MKDVVVSTLLEGLQSATSIEEGIDIGKNLVLEIDFDTIPRIIKKGRVLREIEVLSPGANTLSVNFRTIQLAESAEVYIINDAESYILGPIRKQDVPSVTNFDPGFIPGDKIRILLSEDEQDSGKSQLTISRIGHILFDYFGVHKFQAARVEGIDCFGPGCSSSFGLASSNYFYIAFFAFSYLLSLCGLVG